MAKVKKLLNSFKKELVTDVIIQPPLFFGC